MMNRSLIASHRPSSLCMEEEDFRRQQTRHARYALGQGNSLLTQLDLLQEVKDETWEQKEQYQAQLQVEQQQHTQLQQDHQQLKQLQLSTRQRCQHSERQVHSLRSHLLKLQQEVPLLQDQLHKAACTRLDEQRSNAQLAAEIRAIQAKHMADIRGYVAREEEYEAKLVRAHADADARVEAAQRRTDQALAELDELRVRYETEKNATGAMQLELAATMQQLHVANQQLEAAQQEKQEALAALEAETQWALQTWRVAGDKVEALQQELSELKYVDNDCQRQLGASNAAQAAAEHKLEALRQQQYCSEGLLADCKRLLQDSAAALIVAQHELADTQHKLEAERRRCIEVEDEGKELLDVQVDTWNNNCVSLQRGFDEQTQGLRDQLQQARSQAYNLQLLVVALQQQAQQAQSLWLGPDAVQGEFSQEQMQMAAVRRAQLQEQFSIGANGFTERYARGKAVGLMCAAYCMPGASLEFCKRVRDMLYLAVHPNNGGVNEECVCLSAVWDLIKANLPA